MRLKRTAGDKWFSDCIRIAANWHCEACGVDYTNNRQGLDCSHFIGRANYSTRFIPMNAYAHCMGCHQKLGSDGIAFHDFMLENIGMVGVSILKTLKEDAELGRLARKADKIPKGKRSSEISDFYRAEYRRLEDLRKNGLEDQIMVNQWKPAGYWHDSDAFRLGVYS